MPRDVFDDLDKLWKLVLDKTPFRVFPEEIVLVPQYPTGDAFDALVASASPSKPFLSVGQSVSINEMDMFDKEYELVEITPALKKLQNK